MCPVLLLIESPPAWAQGPGFNRFPLPPLIVLALQLFHLSHRSCFDQVCHRPVVLGLSRGQERRTHLVGIGLGEVRSEGRRLPHTHCRPDSLSYSSSSCSDIPAGCGVMPRPCFSASSFSSVALQV